MVWRATAALLCLVNGLLIAVHAVAEPSPNSAHHAVILQYHHISDKAPAATTVAPDVFRQHLQILKEGGFQVMPLPDVVQALRENRPLPDRAVVITFDDAFDDVYQVAVPILRQFGFPFTVFVSTDTADHNQAGYMSWDQLRELTRKGATLANHTRSHLHLLRKPEDQSPEQWQQVLEDEIQGAEQRIKDETGQSWRLLAYPYGEADEALMHLFLSWGYIGFGQQSGAVDKNLLESGMAPRFPFNRSYQDVKQFRLKASSLPMPLLGEAYPGMVFERAVTPELVLKLAPHQGQLNCFASGQGAIQVETLPEQRYRVQANSPIPVGRSRYNCTLPVAGEKGRFHWYSRFWMRKQDNGSWYKEY